MVLVLVLPKPVTTFTGDCSDHLFPLPLPCKLGHGHPLFLSSRDHQDLLHIVATAPPKPSAAFKGKYCRHLTSYLIEDRINFYLFLLSNDSLSSTSKLETSGASAFSSPSGPRRLSYSSTEASFYTRPSFSCTTTVVSAPTSSGTFPTPSAADDIFYTCSPAPSLLQPLLLCSLCREYLYGPPPIVSQCSTERAQQVLSRYQTTANLRPQCFSRCPSDLPIAPAIAASPPPKSTAIRPSPRLITQRSP
ncbi:hypothetical protein BHE74_00036869 [Ensete ventricosum]|uniref:Uncharacterized protein n=1 Tax=Ensete ventricosum TaxID=4639 RepID=A0A445MGQ5_ENSVE|nr:hypothetical protein BHE74_00036869 [Ensete ventricosum]RZR73452.1 hypothetical protein BHM03_00024497 [Ensete ventricosum]